MEKNRKKWKKMEKNGKIFWYIFLFKIMSINDKNEINEKKIFLYIIRKLKIFKYIHIKKKYKRL